MVRHAMWEMDVGGARAQRGRVGGAAVGDYVDDFLGEAVPAGSWSIDLKWAFTG